MPSAHGRGPSGEALSYDEAIAALQKDYSNQRRRLEPDRCTWLHALKLLLTEHGQGYPTFMTTEAYLIKVAQHRPGASRRTAARYHPLRQAILHDGLR